MKLALTVLALSAQAAFATPFSGDVAATSPLKNLPVLACVAHINPALKATVKVDGEFLAVTADEELGSSFFTLEDRGLSYDKYASEQDSIGRVIYGDWDGNSGAELLFSSEILTAKPGDKVSVTLHSFYNDIAEDDVSNQLDCELTK